MLSIKADRKIRAAQKNLHSFCHICRKYRSGFLKANLTEEPESIGSICGLRTAPVDFARGIVDRSEFPPAFRKYGRTEKPAGSTLIGPADEVPVHEGSEAEASSKYRDSYEEALEFIRFSGKGTGASA